MVRVLIGGSIGLAVAMGIGRFAFTPILPAMQVATGLGPEGAGLLASINYLGYLVGAMTVGLVRPGRARTAAFRTGLVLSAASTAAMGLVPGPAADAMLWWSVLRFVSGVASAGIFVLGIAMVLDALARLGREGAVGWLYAGVGIGISSAGFFVMLTGERLGWQGDWLALGAICAVLSLASWLWVVDPPASSTAPPADAATPAPGSAGAAFSTPLLLLAACYFLQGGGYIVTGTFLVAILKAMPETTALGEVAWILVGFGAMGSALVWTAVARRTSLWWGLILAHIVQIAGIVMPLTGNPAAVALSAVLFGGTFVGIVSLSFALGRQLSAGSSNGVIAALTVLYGIGQIVGPLAAGYGVAHTGSFDSALVGAGATVAVGGLLLLLGLAASARRAAADTRAASSASAS